MKTKSIRKSSTKILAMLLAVLMLVCLFPASALAAFKYQENGSADGYYKLISQKYWQLAPGIEETEVVINNAQGTRRQVVHSVNVDLNNPYTKVIPGYKNMSPTLGNFGVETTSVQALNAEKLGYGNVVAATNAMLSWYTEAYYSQQHPELYGEPLGWNICEGQYYENSQGALGCMSSSYATLVINYDYHPVTGEPRPADMPKVQMRGIADTCTYNAETKKYENTNLTGWEENAISAWAWLVKPDATGTKGINQWSIDHGSSIASRTFIGIKADGSFIVSVSDGEQAPYSTGFTMYEMADYMIKMGCVAACNCDGGGSTTFCTQRPGEDLKVNCSLSDGGERPTTNTILIISTAPADGEFAQATISSDFDYYTPGSTVAFDVLGTDAVGTKVDVPADVQWAIAEEGMGTIADGVFTSNGTEGTVTAQMLYNGNVVGEKVINIATPEAISFDQPVVTVPFGKTAVIPIKGTVNGGLNEIGLGGNDVTFITCNTSLGSFDGLNFTAVDEANAPANLTADVMATLNMGSHPTVSFQLKVGKGSDVLFDFEGGQEDVDIWNVIDNRKGTIWDYDMALSLADSTNGKVHDGDYSMRLELNGLSSKASHSSEYGWIRLGIDGDAIELENARSLGFWMYIPDDCIQLWAQGNYMADSDGDGTYDQQCLISMPPAFPNQVYESVDEPGWYYLEMDLSQYEKVALKDTQQFVKDPSTGASGAKGDFFISFIFARAKNNPILDGGTVIGPYTFYLDNFTVDYSDAVDDRENPEIEKIYMDGAAMAKREVVTTSSNVVNFSANVADATVRTDANKVDHPLYNISGINASSAKVYIDGVEVDASYANGVMTANNVSVADGYHRVKFEICDNVGNKSVMIRVFQVVSGASTPTLKLVPADETLDRILFGSVYWMNLVATDIDKVESVDTVIDMNSVNHWQLDHMIVAEGFNADYAIDQETNSAAITFTATGENTQTGEAILAQIPVRILDYDNDIHVPGKTAAQYWASHEFWGHDLKLDVDKGLVTFTDGTTGTFSNEEFRVFTEMYTSRNYMDATYLTTHGSTHIHTAAPIADKAPTCSEDGYTGRTFCEVCNSVVDWGTTIPATGHTYHFSNGSIVCECGKVFSGTGLVHVDGANYYLVAGNLQSGWIMIDDEWYYFDKTTYAGLDGEQVADCLDNHNKSYEVSFVFDNGRLTHGAWYSTAAGMMYFYGPGAYYDSTPSTASSMPKVIDGKTYLFNRFCIMQTGITMSFTREHDNVTGANFVYYDCGEDGVATLYNGVYEDYLYINGVRQKAYTLHQVNGNYYYVYSGNKIVKNESLKFSASILAGTGLQPGTYTFDENGVMQVQNGVYNDYLYLNGVRQETLYKLMQYAGNYYYIYNAYKVAKNITLKFSAAKLEGTGLQPGYYDFDNNGVMQVKNGVYNDYLYVNGVLQTAYKLVQYNGNFYYVYDANKVAKNTTLYFGASRLEGTGLVPGYYTFDENGVMQLKNGVENGYLYINGVRQQSLYKLVELEGDYYYIYDAYKVARNVTLYFSAAKLEGTGLSAGRYTFDENGVMQIPE